jgi:hypothetical protein
LRACLQSRFIPNARAIGILRLLHKKSARSAMQARHKRAVS